MLASVAPARMRNSEVFPAPFKPSTSNRSPRPKSNDTSSNTGGPPYPLLRPRVVTTVTPLCGGSGNFTVRTRSFFRTPVDSDSIRAIRFSMLCAIVAFVAFAPNLSTTSCKRATSLACIIAFFSARTSSSARERLYWLYVPRYSYTVPMSSSFGRSRCNTRVIASSSNSRSWLITNNAPL